MAPSDNVLVDEHILNKVILGGTTVDYENQAGLPSSTPKSSSLDGAT